MAKLPRYLSTSEVVAFLRGQDVRVDIDTVRGWARRGLVGSFKLPGGHLRINGEDVEKLVPPPKD